MINMVVLSTRYNLLHGNLSGWNKKLSVLGWGSVRMGDRLESLTKT
jgi:hypothetical protein